MRQDWRRPETAISACANFLFWACAGFSSAIHDAPPGRDEFPSLNNRCPARYGRLT
ncbi:hypothetical protein AGR3A_Cc380017 [Agrobacterium tomkonis CFBP 6623]|uniref:Uncharacterized protein n=1 Tax=Agrobacterium tomkonis CFBP 6623 TaxID=1183432 RepID=A0A1S7Q1R0_9HYPH|nr:hypothetical protein AGR3A_Cc380017 [Agrobacterium tomkonis CFBP 6623]